MDIQTSRCQCSIIPGNCHNACSLVYCVKNTCIVYHYEFNYKIHLNLILWLNDTCTGVSTLDGVLVIFPVTVTKCVHWLQLGLQKYMSFTTSLHSDSILIACCLPETFFSHKFIFVENTNQINKIFRQQQRRWFLGRTLFI